jgi:hypothetical protein
MVHTIDGCIEHHELSHGKEKNKSARGTDITAPQPKEPVVVDGHFSSSESSLSLECLVFSI